MSRIAKNSIKMPSDTSCKFEDSTLIAKGKLGEISLSINPLFIIEFKEGELFVLPKNDKDKVNPIWGTTRAHVANTIKGVSEGFSKKNSIANMPDDNVNKIYYVSLSLLLLFIFAKVLTKN
jgi:large subunit ribosomal protein L6